MRSSPDRAGLYASGAQRAAPDATQVARRWHLLHNVGEALRLAVDRHRKAVRVAGKAWSAEMDDTEEVASQSPSEAVAKHGDLRRLRRDERRDCYAEILRLRQAGLSPWQIAPRIGMSVRTVSWLAVGGEPEHRRPPPRHTCIDGFRDYLEQRWRDRQQKGAFLWAKVEQRGFEGSKATLYRWVAARRQKPARGAATSQCQPSSRRICAWL